MYYFQPEYIGHAVPDSTLFLVYQDLVLSSETQEVYEQVYA